MVFHQSFHNVPIKLQNFRILATYKGSTNPIFQEKGIKIDDTPSVKSINYKQIAFEFSLNLHFSVLYEYYLVRPVVFLLYYTPCVVEERLELVYHVIEVSLRKPFFDERNSPQQLVQKLLPFILVRVIVLLQVFQEVWVFIHDLSVISVGEFGEVVVVQTHHRRGPSAFVDYSDLSEVVSNLKQGDCLVQNSCLVHYVYSAVTFLNIVYPIIWHVVLLHDVLLWHSKASPQSANQ